MKKEKEQKQKKKKIDWKRTFKNNGYMLGLIINIGFDFYRAWLGSFVFAEHLSVPIRP